MLLLSTGLSFLLIAFFLRAISSYDPYNGRTIGYGVTISFVALLGIFLKDRHSNISLGALIVVIVISFCASEISHLRSDLGKLSNSPGSYQDAFQAIHKYGANANQRHYNNVVSLVVPSISMDVAGNGKLFYGSKSNIIPIWTSPGSKQDTLASLIARITASSGGCAIDYSQFPSKNDLKKFLRRTYPVGLDFKGGYLHPKLKRKFSYDSQLASKLIKVYNGKSLVSCVYLRE
jgi:hypothetical protein